MKDLIEALTILMKYMDEDNKWPTHCEHDVMYVCGVDDEAVTEEDKKRLEELGFFPSDEGDGFQSYRFGSC